MLSQAENTSKKTSEASPQPKQATVATAAAEEAVQATLRTQREETPEAVAERIQLVLRIGHLTPAQAEVSLGQPSSK